MYKYQYLNTHIVPDPRSPILIPDSRLFLALFTRLSSSVSVCKTDTNFGWRALPHRTIATYANSWHNTWWGGGGAREPKFRIRFASTNSNSGGLLINFSCYDYDIIPYSSSSSIHVNSLAHIISSSFRFLLSWLFFLFCIDNDVYPKPLFSGKRSYRLLLACGPIKSCSTTHVFFLRRGRTIPESSYTRRSESTRKEGESIDKGCDCHGRS